MKFGEAIRKVEELVEVVKITQAQDPHQPPQMPGVELLWFDFRGSHQDRPITGSFSVAQSENGFEPGDLFGQYQEGERALNVVWLESQFVESLEDGE